MFLVTVCSSLAWRVSCAASCFALICCLSSSFSFFFLSFASFLILLARRVDLFFLALLIFSSFVMVLDNFPFPHFLGLFPLLRLILFLRGVFASDAAISLLSSIIVFCDLRDEGFGNHVAGIKMTGEYLYAVSNFDSM